MAEELDLDQSDWRRERLVNVANSERLPLGPSTFLQGRYREWRMVLQDDSLAPDLSGKSSQEVEHEADRLKLWEEFSSFEQFNRSLHSWSIREGRAYHKFKTKWNMHVRVCRYAEHVRPPWREKHTPGDFDENCDSSGLDGDQGIVCRDNFMPHTESGNAQGSTCPLLETTNLHQSQRSSHNPGRDFIRHTREWIPDSFPRQAVPPKEKVRRQSKTGACGQFSRLLDPIDNTEGKPAACPFRVRCQRIVEGKFVITQLNLLHTCPRMKHKWRGPIQKSQWLGETLANRVTRNPRVPIKEIMNGLKTDYKKNANYHQMWRARDIVKDLFLGGQRHSFHMIPSLLDRLKSEDVGSVVDWSTRLDNRIFQRAFICPSATRNALQYLQPLVSLDACHTKNRKFPTQLFLATALDGNSEVFILAYAIAPVENYDNWCWFLDMLERSVRSMNDVSVPLISDRQKGLLKAVAEIFPGKVHGHCAFHLRGNVKKGYGKAAEQFFWELVYANSKRRFERVLEHLAACPLKGVAAVEYIKKIDETLYSRHAFPLPRLGKVTSNPAEQCNSGLLEIREYAPFKLLVALWDYIQRKFNTRRIVAADRQEVLSVPAFKRHVVNLRTYGQWQVADDGRSKAKVHTTDGGEEYAVSLALTPTCSCVELQEMIWPCEHIMAWDDRDGKDFTRHFHACWKTETLRRLYQPIVPIIICTDLDAVDSCFPPAVAVKKGRHRVVRIESGLTPRLPEELGPDEFYDAEGTLFAQYPIADEDNLLGPVPTAPTSASTSRRRIRSGQEGRPTRKVGPGKSRCRKCSRLGHNSRTCERYQPEFEEPADIEQSAQILDPQHEDVPAVVSEIPVEMEVEQVSQFVSPSAPASSAPALIPAGMYDESDAEMDSQEDETSVGLLEGDWTDTYTLDYITGRISALASEVLVSTGRNETK